LAPFCSSSPLCGSFQLFGKPDVQEAILDVLSNETDIRDSSATHHFQLLKRNVPILADAILDNMTSDGHLSEHAAEVIEYILEHIISLLSDCEVPHADRYGPPIDSPYEYFPGFPTQLGKCHYSIDKTNGKDDLFCRKL
jgi:hypothetical protein